MGKAILTAAALYAGFLAHVALLTGATTLWAPNLTLLAGLAATRSPGGLAWAALAGLLCDCLYERPLGTTMLVATLVLAFARQSRLAERLSQFSTAAAAFAGVALIESTSRALASVATKGLDWVSIATTALSIAATSAAAVAVTLVLLRSLGMNRGRREANSREAARSVFRLSERG